MKPLNLHDIIIDRSEAAKAAFVNKARQELKDLGYSVVLTDWLHLRIAEPVRKSKERKSCGKIFD